MSMYRQLWLAIILSMLLALAGSLFASLLAARAYLEQQLGAKNSDNAAALALSLSQQQPDPVSVELAVAALFDSGHYASIRVHDPNGALIIERVARLAGSDVPEWFVRMLPIAADPGTAQITSGWRQFGTVTLVSHAHFAHEALWTSIRQMVAALALAGFVGGYLGTLILRRLRQPLQAVIAQAEAISSRRFVTIPAPEVPELRQLALAMNATVTRLKSMFEDEAARLEALRRDANLDPVTGLAKREFFISRLHSALEGEESTGGSLCLIRVADLAGINRRLGRAATDDLLRRIGEKVGAGATANPEGLAGRMNGADFALLLPGQATGREVAEQLLRDLVRVMADFVEGGPSAHAGMCRFQRGTDPAVLLSQADAALIAAEAEGANSVREAIPAAEDELPRSAEEWTRALRQALDRRWLRLVTFPVVDMRHRLLHGECPLRLKLDAESEWLPAGRFLPVAKRLGLAAELDLAALALGLAELERQPAMPGLAVNLAAASIAGEEFRRKLAALLRGHRKAAARLWLEVEEAGALQHLEALRSLCALLRGFQCRLGIEHFGRQFSQIGRLHDLGLNYVKVDASFTRQLDANPGNQAFLKGLCAIAHGIGMLVIAEGVAAEAEFAALAAAGFDGATGPGVTLPS